MRLWRIICSLRRRCCHSIKWAFLDGERYSEYAFAEELKCCELMHCELREHSSGRWRMEYGLWQEDVVPGSSLNMKWIECLLMSGSGSRMIENMTFPNMCGGSIFPVPLLIHWIHHPPYRNSTSHATLSFHSKVHSKWLNFMLFFNSIAFNLCILRECDIYANEVFHSPSTQYHLLFNPISHSQQ